MASTGHGVRQKHIYLLAFTRGREARDGKGLNNEFWEERVNEINPRYYNLI